MVSRSPTTVFELDEGPLSIRSYGKALKFDPTENNLEQPIEMLEFLAKKRNLRDVLWQRLPNRHSPERRFKVGLRNELPKKPGNILTINNERFDGVILTKPGQTVAFATRDCPVLVLSGGYGTPIAVLHCGRDALQAADLDWSQDGSVIKEAMRLIRPRLYADARLTGYVTMGIGTKHFQNDRYLEILTYLRDTWGESVVPEKHQWCIDLLELIRAQLQKYAGLTWSDVEWDGLDTKTDKRLASMRGGHNGYHNLVMVSYI